MPLVFSGRCAARTVLFVFSGGCAARNEVLIAPILQETSASRAVHARKRKPCTNPRDSISARRPSRQSPVRSDTAESHTTSPLSTRAVLLYVPLTAEQNSSVIFTEILNFPVRSMGFIGALKSW